MNSSDFVAQLLEENTEILKRLQPNETLEADVGKSINMVALLKAALRNEMEAIEIAALWIPDTAEPDIKLALARQTGDEAKHYRLIKERLANLGEDPSISPAEAPPKLNFLDIFPVLAPALNVLQLVSSPVNILPWSKTINL